MYSLYRSKLYFSLMRKIALHLYVLLSFYQPGRAVRGGGL